MHLMILDLAIALRLLQCFRYQGKTSKYNLGTPLLAALNYLKYYLTL